MKTKNQTEQDLLELAVTKAANDDGIAPVGSRESGSAGRKQGWSPFEVWRTRVKLSPPLGRSESAPI
jgi:hypothetical protein